MYFLVKTSLLFWIHNHLNSLLNFQPWYEVMMKRSWSICWLLLISPWQHDSRRGHARSGCGERVTSALVRWAARGALAGCELALPPRVITIWRTISNTQLDPDTYRVTTEIISTPCQILNHLNQHFIWTVTVASYYTEIILTLPDSE